MKAAAVAIKENEQLNFRDIEKLKEYIKAVLKSCVVQEADIVVFPALLGCFYKCSEGFLEDMLEISMEFESINICPGSFWEQEDEKKYHSSTIIKNGKVLLKQRQLYLARWEREAGLSRGVDVDIVDINGFRTGLLLSTDAFYPQVSRRLALLGADLIIAPMAIINAVNQFALQLTGVWQNVQSNLFFAIESGYKGSFRNKSFNSLSAIHAPLGMTKKDDGFLKLEKSEQSDLLLVFKLDPIERQKAINRFNTIKQLNPDFYNCLFKK